MPILLLTCVLFSQCQKDESLDPVSSKEILKTAYTSTNTWPKKLNLSRVGFHSGHAYHLHDWFGVGGDTQWSTTSTLRVYENGKQLGPAHSLRTDVIAHGKGRFSHWGNNLYFSASDNTDPRTNGRSYTYAISDIAGSSPIEGNITAPSTAKSLNMSRVTLSSGNEYQLFDWFGVAGDTEWAKHSTLKIFEDGRELGAARSSRTDIAWYGKGRFRHWGNTLYFSTSDNSDPRKNGRKYTYTIDGSTSTNTAPAPAAPTYPTPEAPVIPETYGQERVIFDTGAFFIWNLVESMPDATMCDVPESIRILRLSISVFHQNCFADFQQANSLCTRFAICKCVQEACLVIDNAA